MTKNRAADLAVLGSTIRTLDPARPWAAALAVRDGMLVSVGSDDEVKNFCGPKTEVVDGRDLVLVPGLVDSHQHVLSASTMAPGIDVSSVRSLAELRLKLASEHDRLAEGGWVQAWGLDYNVFGSLPLSNEVVEDAVAGFPALVRTMDGHTGIATKKALELAGVRGPVHFDDGSEVVCREGVPTGILNEPSAMNLVAAAAPPVSAGERVRHTLAVLDGCVASGLTQIHQMDGDEATFSLVQDLEESGQLRVRVVVPVWHRPGTDADTLRTEVALARRLGTLWRGGVVKFFADGVIDNGTGWLVDSDTRGGSQQPFWPEPSEYEVAVAAFAAEGFQCITHATGDGAVRAALDAYRKAGARPGVRHRIEHIETLQDDDVARFAAQGVVASMQPLHMQWRKPDGTDWWAGILGRERAARGFRCQDLLAKGAVVTLGSDWPIAHYDPRLGMAWARLRRPPHTDQPAFEPSQRLTGLQAIEGYTTMPALAASEEAVSGRIKVGYRADLTGFVEDPVECPADDLVDLPVRLTVVAGRVVFCS